MYSLVGTVRGARKGYKARKKGGRVLDKKTQKAKSKRTQKKGARPNQRPKEMRGKKDTDFSFRKKEYTYSSVKDGAMRGGRKDRKLTILI